MSKRKELENFVKLTNAVKFTLGLPILLFVSCAFLRKLSVEYIKLYINITVHPNEIRKNVERINQLKAGLKLLWQPNQLEV